MRRVVADVFAEEPDYTSVRCRKDSTPSVGVISPSKDLRVDGADLVSLICPPPAQVRVDLPARPMSTCLDVRAGVDASVLQDLPSELAGGSVVCSLSANGELAFEARIPLVQVGRLPGTEWVECRGLKHGDARSLLLETRVLDAQGRQVVPARPLRVGFGGLVLVEESRLPRTRSSPAEPNIVLVVMDTQRADRLSAYGYGRPTSPNLEALAQRGTLFEEAYSASNWTWPSTASILTGLTPEEHGLVDLSSCFLPERLRTLPEALQEAGFTTAAWSANYLVADDKNFDQGFEFFQSARRVSQPSKEVVPDVLRWMERWAGTRFFLYVHLLDPHAPLRPLPGGRRLLAADVPEDFSPTAINDFRWCLLEQGHTEEGEVATERCVGPEEQRWISDLYDACTWSGDRWVGRLLEKIEQLGLTDETLFVFTSDHGEELFEHGLLTHGQSLHPELVHVPLILAGPGIAAGERLDAPLSNRFLAQTLAALGGAELAPGPDLFELARRSEPVLTSTTCGFWKGVNFQPILGLRTRSHSLHWAPTGAEWGQDRPGHGDWHLYDIVQDPFEQTDLAKTETETLLRLHADLVERIGALKPQTQAVPFAAGEATLQRLRDLGYVGED